MGAQACQESRFVCHNCLSHLESMKPYSTTPSAVFRVSKDHYEEFKAISPARTPKPWQTRVTWKPPPLDSFKINYDVAVFTENNNFGTVVIN